MANLKFDREITALFVIDRTTISFPRVANQYAAGSKCCARGEASCFLSIASSLPSRRLRDLEVHCAHTETILVEQGVRIRHLWKGTASYIYVRRYGETDFGLVAVAMSRFQPRASAARAIQPGPAPIIRPSTKHCSVSQISKPEPMGGHYGTCKHRNSNNESRTGKAGRHQGMVGFVVHWWRRSDARFQQYRRIEKLAACLRAAHVSR